MYFEERDRVLEQIMREKLRITNFNIIITDNQDDI